MKKDTNTFNILQAKISYLKEEWSNLSESYGESHADSFFILKENYHGLEPKHNTAEPNIL